MRAEPRAARRRADCSWAVTWARSWRRRRCGRNALSLLIRASELTPPQIDAAHRKHCVAVQRLRVRTTIDARTLQQSRRRRHLRAWQRRARTHRRLKFAVVRRRSRLRARGEWNADDARVAGWNIHGHRRAQCRWHRRRVRGRRWARNRGGVRGGDLDRTPCAADGDRLSARCDRRRSASRYGAGGLDGLCAATVRRRRTARRTRPGDCRSTWYFRYWFREAAAGGSGSTRVARWKSNSRRRARNTASRAVLYRPPASGLAQRMWIEGQRGNAGLCTVKRSIRIRLRCSDPVSRPGARSRRWLRCSPPSRPSTSSSSLGCACARGT